MRKIKKIFTVLSFIFIIVFGYTACGELSELEKAINNSDVSNVFIEIHSSAATRVATQTIDGNKSKITEDDVVTYIERSGDKYYRYFCSNSVWHKEDFTDFISKFDVAVFSHAEYLFFFEAKDFVNEDGGYSMTESASQAYCEKTFVKTWESLGAQVNFAEVEYVTLKILNEKISEFEIKYSLILNEQPVQTNIIKLLLSNYGTVKVDLPKIE